MTILSRRRTLSLLTATAASFHPLFGLGSAEAQFRLGRKPKPKAPAPQPLVLFGTDTGKPGARGVYAARFNPVTGQISAPTLAAATSRPSWMALNGTSSRRILYVANEGADEASSTISAYVLDPKTSALTLMGSVPAGGAGPCYVSVDASGRALFVANYSGGTVVSYQVHPDGTLSQPVDRIDFRRQHLGEHGPNARQDGPHPHSALVSPGNHFLVVNDLGNDQIALFPIDAASAHLGTPNLVATQHPGAGPRHLAFHPNGRWAYSVEELANRIHQYLWNTMRGTADQPAQAELTYSGHSLSTLDPGFQGTNTAAEIAVSVDGRFLYVSNRGENTLVTFSIDPSRGVPAFLDRISCGGRTPRHFTFDPSGRWLLCGNQESDSITVFARDENSGRLRGPVQTLPLPAPMFTLFA